MYETQINSRVGLISRPDGGGNTEKALILNVSPLDATQLRGAGFITLWNAEK